jgi:hypothetical protein
MLSKGLAGQFTYLVVDVVHARLAEGQSIHITVSLI